MTTNTCPKARIYIEKPLPDKCLTGNEVCYPKAFSDRVDSPSPRQSAFPRRPAANAAVPETRGRSAGPPHFPFSFMAGLVPAIHALHKPIVKLFPIGVLAVDQPYLPGAGPMLHGSFALPGIEHIFMEFGKDKPPQTVTFGKALDHPSAMLPCPSSEIIGHADVQRAVSAVGHHVNPSAGHHRTPFCESRRGWPEQVRP
jgi:hypothetical protein